VKIFVVFVADVGTGASVIRPGDEVTLPLTSVSSSDKTPITTPTTRIHKNKQKQKVKNRHLELTRFELAVRIEKGCICCETAVGCVGTETVAVALLARSRATVEGETGGTKTVIGA
jgi:hypothetical protein